MYKSTEEIINSVIADIATIPEVQSAGISGGKADFPIAGEGDIDLFLYCDKIPASNIRKEKLDALGGMINDCRIDVFHSPHFGVGDFALVNGVETWLMYFTLEETLADVERILAGKRPDKVDNGYFPVGRCAMFKTMDIRLDRNGFLGGLQDRMNTYPPGLVKTLTEYHLEKLGDTEDFGRAVKRQDVLFYHTTLDRALDHFLQALFALNKTFFPSRKRSMNYIDQFTVKPENCAGRLLQVLKSGSEPQGIGESYQIWCGLVKELGELNR